MQRYALVVQQHNIGLVFVEDSNITFQKKPIIAQGEFYSAAIDRISPFPRILFHQGNRDNYAYPVMMVTPMVGKSLDMPVIAWAEFVASIFDYLASGICAGMGMKITHELILWEEGSQNIPFQRKRSRVRPAGRPRPLRRDIGVEEFYAVKGLLIRKNGFVPEKKTVGFQSGFVPLVPPVGDTVGFETAQTHLHYGGLADADNVPVRIIGC